MKINNININMLTNNSLILSINSIGTFLISYNSVIAGKTPNGIILDKQYWDYSKTTGKHRNEFLGETKPKTQKKIDNGDYKLDNLN